MSASNSPLREVRCRLGSVFAVLALSTGISACGDSRSDSDDGVTVFAAASLTESFTELGQRYEEENEGVEVEFSFAASSELAAQIDQGAPADVFASADQPNMERVVESGMSEGQPVDFASNALEIALPQGNPGEVESLADLANDDLLVAACALEAPCGTASAGVFRKSGIQPSIDSYEPDVKSVLTKVVLGEVDAGLVYHSDVLASGGRIESVRIPAVDQVVNTYPITLVRDPHNRDGGQQFIDLVLSQEGRAELKEWGFRAP